MIDKIICEVDGLRENPDSDRIATYRLDLMVYSPDEGFLKMAMPQVVKAVSAELEKQINQYLGVMKG